MRFIKHIFIGVLIASQARAGLPPTSTRGSGESNFTTTFKFHFPNFAVTRSGTTTSLGLLSVAGGGTGAGSFTANNVLLGNGTSAFQVVAPGTSGNVLTSNGTTWASTASSVTTYGWAGYHAQNCDFTVTSNSYASFAADASCTFTQTNNANFGTVTSQLSGSDPLPGTVYTFPQAGLYSVCAHAKGYGGNIVGNVLVRIWDGTTQIAEVEAASTNAQDMYHLCGIYNAAASTVTISLQAKHTSSSTVHLNGGSSSLTTVEWTINRIH